MLPIQKNHQMTIIKNKTEGKNQRITNDRKQPEMI